MMYRIIFAVARDSTIQQGAEDLAGVGAARACDFFRGAGGDDAAAVFATFRTKIDDVVGGFDYVEIVLDDQYGIS